MLVFIDDSGDAGFKIDEGSSRFFVIACVVFDDDLDAEEAALRIKRHRQSLGWREEREFKFNKLSKTHRLDLIDTIKDLKFRVRAIVVDKKRIRSPILRMNRETFYNYIIKEVLLNSGDTINDARLRLDGHGDRAYKKAALTYFRQELGDKSSIVRNAKFVDSKKDNLIQLADIVAGAIHRSMQKDKTDQFLYILPIQSRVEDIWNFK